MLTKSINDILAQGNQLSKENPEEDAIAKLAPEAGLEATTYETGEENGRASEKAGLCKEGLEAPRHRSVGDDPSLAGHRVSG